MLVLVLLIGCALAALSTLQGVKQVSAGGDKVRHDHSYGQTTGGDETRCMGPAGDDCGPVL
mgnify:CR=1 FL=1